MKLICVKTVLTSSPDEAAEFIKRGGIVAFPTETVYGLGADIFNVEAVARVFEAKQRPSDNPLIAHISGLDQVKDLSNEISESARRLIDVFFPGPLTIVLRKTELVPMIATAGLDTIGIRMPRSTVAQQFLSACSTPVVAPSANLSGRPSPTTWQAVLEDLDARIDCILKATATEIGIESTVVDCTSSIPHILRSGSVSVEQIRAIMPEVIVQALNEPDAPRSPGMRHRHYSPRAQVVIVEDVKSLTENMPGAYIGMSRPAVRFTPELICADTTEYAHTVFEFFRHCDRHGIRTIYCEKVAEIGIGAALMDRLKRAAE